MDRLFELSPQFRKKYMRRYPQTQNEFVIKGLFNEILTKLNPWVELVSSEIKISPQCHPKEALSMNGDWRFRRGQYGKVYFIPKTGSMFLKAELIDIDVYLDEGHDNAPLFIEVYEITINDSNRLDEVLLIRIGIDNIEYSSRSSGIKKINYQYAYLQEGISIVIW